MTTTQHDYNPNKDDDNDNNNNNHNNNTTISDSNGNANHRDNNDCNDGCIEVLAAPIWPANKTLSTPSTKAMCVICTRQ